MNTLRSGLLLIIFLTLTHFATGCMIRPAIVAEPAHITVVQQAPVRVYHNGVWLHYHDGYYRHRQADRWVVAHSVPTRISRFHRPPQRRVRRARTVRSKRRAPTKRRTTRRTTRRRTTTPR